VDAAGEHSCERVKSHRGRQTRLDGHPHPHLRHRQSSLRVVRVRFLRLRCRRRRPSQGGQILNLVQSSGRRGRQRDVANRDRRRATARRVWEVAIRRLRRRPPHWGACSVQRTGTTIRRQAGSTLHHRHLDLLSCPLPSLHRQSSPFSTVLGPRLPNLSPAADRAPSPPVRPPPPSTTMLRAPPTRSLTVHPPPLLPPHPLPFSTDHDRKPQIRTSPTPPRLRPPPLTPIPSPPLPSSPCFMVEVERPTPQTPRPPRIGIVRRNRRRRSGTIVSEMDRSLILVDLRRWILKRCLRLVLGEEEREEEGASYRRDQRPPMPHPSSRLVWEVEQQRRGGNVRIPS
jgi:hypothetical protein